MNQDDNEPDNIWIAVSNGDFDRVKHLITQEGVSVNAQDDLGYSPMHAAASYGEVAIMEFLYSLGGDVAIRDNDGDTPLLVTETPAAFELLVQFGADVNVRNSEGQGIVEKVVEDENEELFEYLVERGTVADQDLITRQRAYFQGAEGRDDGAVDLEEFLKMQEQGEGEGQEGDDDEMNT